MGLSLISLLPAFERGVKSMRTQCDLRSCHNTQLMRVIPGGRPGIAVGQHWYCSVDCFVQAAQVSLAELSDRSAVEVPRNPRLSLGLVLLSRGYLTAAQLRHAALQSHLDGKPLESALLRLQLATDRQLAAARSIQWGLPMLSSESTGRMVEADLSCSILNSCGAVPVHYSPTAKRVILGFIDRIDYSLLRSIEQLAGLRADACFMTPSEFTDQLERFTRPADYEEIVVTEPGPFDKMARTIGRAAVDLGAREGSFAQCRGHIWVRLTGKRGRVDVVFQMRKAFGRLKASDSETVEDSVAFAG
jgi:hypothetical protein